MCMQIANYSQDWSLDISWVGEDCGLVSRALLSAGETHVELMSSNHVWCLTVSKKAVPNELNSRYQMDEAGNFPEDVSDLSSCSFLFRPPSSEKSTQFAPACSIIWIPWQSIAFSECSKQSMSSNLGEETTVDLFIKVFDSGKGGQKGNQKKSARKK